MNTAERIAWFDQTVHKIFPTSEFGLLHLSLLKQLERTDYFTAPASSAKSKHHCYEGGLFDHSKEVYEELLAKKVFPERSCFLIGMFHDVCKIGLYTPNLNKDGSINQRQPYSTNSKVAAFGHGAGSLIWCLDHGIPLEREERLGILWHMTSDVYTWNYVRQHVHVELPDIDYIKTADEKSANSERRDTA